ncbi:ribosome maturation factor RimM [Aestuariimicrobium ganziense]|uniref:ribosome maturation factor RimM n=1 Tax=Aestuariimicrobium ganziense TaxID=2773677 RepID=UPI0019431BBA|nr:ribosome maturation factor RimM [Aestuariimicrobium ganziense]
MADQVEVVVGALSRAHGIRGDVAVDVRTDEPERRFADGALLRIENSARTLTVAGSRWHSGRLLVRFAELADRTAVEALRGAVLVVDVPADEVPDDPEEFYDRQLVGLQAVQGGRVVGTITSVVHLPSQDLLAIDVDGTERLVPFVTALVPTVDLAAGQVHLADDVAGLLDDVDETEDDDPDGGDVA